jgi:hypothetical protein
MILAPARIHEVAPLAGTSREAISPPDTVPQVMNNAKRPTVLCEIGPDTWRTVAGLGIVATIRVTGTRPTVGAGTR